MADIDRSGQFRALLLKCLDDTAADAAALSHDLWMHPEIADEEFRSCRVLSEAAEAEGFRTEQSFDGIPTAFLAEYRTDVENGSGRPVSPEGHIPAVAFLAEYDALPGYGDLSPDGSGNAHACGHNWISAVSYKAAVSLVRALKAWNRDASPGERIEARVLLIGTPAEETWGAKIKMADEGVLKALDMDAVFECHLSGMEANCFDNYLLALSDLRYTFRGKASHAAVHPELGRNALDALHLMYAGVSCLRQQVLPDTRIHARVMEGGEAVNIIPDKTVVQYYARSGKRSYLEELVERINDCARGAALMAGCTVEIDRKPFTFSDMRNNSAIVKRAEQYLLEAAPEARFRQDSVFTAPSGDIGNVSYEAPSFYGVFSTFPFSGGADIHDAAYVNVPDSEEALRLLGLAARTIASVGADVLTDEAFRSEVRELFRKE